MEAEISEQSLAHLYETAAVVADEYEASQSAKADAFASEVMLLDAVVAALKPALPAIGSRRFGSGGEHEGAPWSHPCEEHAVLLVGQGQPIFDDQTEHVANDDAQDLFLSASGCWLHVTYAGQESEWSAREQRISTTDVVREYGVPRIVKVLQDKLSRAQGSRQKVTAKMGAHSERMKALAVLLLAPTK